jgi:hypothetical protein
VNFNDTTTEEAGLPFLRRRSREVRRKFLGILREYGMKFDAVFTLG